MIRNRRRRELRIRPFAEPEHPLARPEMARIVAARHDLSREILPERQRKARRVELLHVAFADFPIDWVHTRVAHFREHAARADLRQRCFFVFQLFGAAVLRDPNRLYQARHRRVLCRRHRHFSFSLRYGTL